MERFDWNWQLVNWDDVIPLCKLRIKWPSEAGLNGEKEFLNIFILQVLDDISYERLLKFKIS